MTRQRSVILDELRRLGSHPTADELYHSVRKTLPRISLGTVYRNLDVLSDMGMIRKLEIGGGQMRFDGTLREHYHVRCMECGKIGDVPVDILGGCTWKRKRVDGFTIVDCDPHFIGVCDECMAKNAAPGEHPNHDNKTSQQQLPK
ncbi:MAG: transcriptional repressor [Candidatus Latescibacteria bacterium]|nr:transcriptional repressor [Candidatus Latescibacterota bacterium]